VDCWVFASGSAAPTIQAFDRRPWSPTGLPQPGESLLASSVVHNPNPATINVRDNDLVGDLLKLDHNPATAS
jgi:hypothetical protein